MYSDKININIITSLLVSHGVKHVVVCPGSRNAALVNNFSVCPDIVCHPVTDERSAGFFALGLRQATGSPVAVCTTSGSALLNLLPAVAEATYQHQGIIVISADRPSAWIGQLDGQTLPQSDALGRFVAFSASLPEPGNEVERWECNRIVNEALIVAQRPEHPSVHINVPVSEPLFNFTNPELPRERVVRTLDDPKQLGAAIRKMKRPLLVVAQQVPSAVDASDLKALALSMPVLYEPLSAGFGQPCLTDQLLFALGDSPEHYRPDCVIYAGGNTVSKRLRNFLRTSCSCAYHITLSDDGTLHDVSCNTRLLVHSSLFEAVPALKVAAESMDIDSTYLKAWDTLREKVLSRHESFVPEYSQMLSIKLLEDRVGERDVVHYANSMSVRIGAVYARGYRYCNRGLNGIEGSVSTAAGASAALGTTGGRLFCVTGDLSFFYDSNALWPAELSGNFRILLLNNSQGSVFKSLPGLEACPVRDELIAGKHQMTAEGLCAQHGVKYFQANNAFELEKGIDALFDAVSDRPVLLEVRTDAETDQKIYKEYYDHISHELD